LFSHSVKGKEISLADKISHSERQTPPPGKKTGYAKEMPVLHDLNSQSHKAGIFFARETIVFQKRNPTAY
jgi:hypothetical protein